MKKITACLLVLSMILNLASCGISGSRPAEPADSEVSDQSALAESTDSVVSDQSAPAQPEELFSTSNEDYSTMGNLADDSPNIDGITTAPVWYVAQDRKYYLNDEKRRFQVGNFNGKSSDDNDNFKNVYSSGNSIFGDTKEEDPFLSSQAQQLIGRN